MQLISASWPPAAHQHAPRVPPFPPQAINPEQAARLYGRHFDHRDDLVSRISRKSIDILKTMFRDDLSKDDWRLVVRLKKVFNID